jgi:LmbE family N-acetylglucosaminyl deacetylase
MDPISRRSFVSSAAALPLAVANKRLKVVVTGGHPGDPEYGCGGTIARYSDAGHEVVILYLNRGEKQCPAAEDDPGATVRVAEAKKACEILKSRPVFATQCDAHSIVDNEHYDRFRSLLEEEKPDVVFTHWPIDSHRDHRALSTLVHDAWFRMKGSFALYYYEVGEDTMMFSPTDYVDISSTEERRRRACYAHASQTPDHFYPEQTLISRFRGAEAGFAHAEAFTKHVRSPAGLLPA